jgi:RNA polymerase sigma-70 factor (ECF subfamily)
VNRLAPERNREAMDDDELITAVAGGDDAALRELFSRHAPWLAGRLRAGLPAAEVEDVLQETFLAVWQGARGYRPAAQRCPAQGGSARAGSARAGSARAGSARGGSARAGSGQGGSGQAWLWGIARRQAALLLRRRGPATAALPEMLAAGGRAGGEYAGDPAEAALARADLARAVAAMGSADGPEREVWRLMYVEDRPVAEVAELMGVPEGTVKSRAHRARRLLRGALGGRAAEGDTR